MRVEKFARFVQIGIEKENPLLPKFLKYATKYFQRQYRLSSSVLILDDGERFKKDYLINWAYFSSMQSADSRDLNFAQKSAPDSNKSAPDSNNIESSAPNDAVLEEILEVSYLPIRIKIISTDSLLECVNVSFGLLGLNRAVLVLDRQNHVAKRYLCALLSSLVISSDMTHIYLDCKNADFWRQILDVIGNKIIHNVRLEFDYDSFKGASFGASSYLTQKEKQLNKAYATLGCDVGSSFFDIRARYLELIKEYHPDKVFGKDEELIKSYNMKFIELKEAFDIIKASFEGA